MNLELLFKFVRLANHNPNEHEANAAARRVCKMIEDGKFQIINKQQPPTFRIPTVQTAPHTWNDVERSTEPEFKSRPQNPPRWDKVHVDFHGFNFNDFFNQFNIPFHGGNPGGNKTDSNRYGTPNPSRETRPRICVKCGKTVMTRRVTNIFVCNPCEANEFKETNSNNNQTET